MGIEAAREGRPATWPDLSVPSPPPSPSGSRHGAQAGWSRRPSRGGPSRRRSPLEKSPSAISSAPDLRLLSCLPRSSTRWVLDVACGDEPGKLMWLDSIPILHVHLPRSSDSFPSVQDSVDTAVGSSTMTSSPSAGRSRAASSSGDRR
jgi:hypothetical protein